MLTTSYGRRSAIENLVQALRSLKSRYDDRATWGANITPAMGDRMAAHQSLKVVLAFLQAIDEEDLGFGLTKAMIALSNVQAGVAEEMFAPPRPKKGGRPLSRYEVEEVRGCCAAAVELLMCAGVKKICACERVLTKLGQKRVAALAGDGPHRPAVGWRTISRWRDKAREGGDTVIHHVYRVSLANVAGRDPGRAADALLVGEIAKMAEL